jgi:hypothetical protein
MRATSMHSATDNAARVSVNCCDTTSSFCALSYSLLRSPDVGLGSIPSVVECCRSACCGLDGGGDARARTGTCGSNVPTSPSLRGWEKRNTRTHRLSASTARPSAVSACSFLDPCRRHNPARRLVTVRHRHGSDHHRSSHTREGARQPGRSDEHRPRMCATTRHTGGAPPSSSICTSSECTTQQGSGVSYEYLCGNLCSRSRERYGIH